MKIALEPRASKIVTFLPLEPCALPNFCPELRNPLEGLTSASAAWPQAYQTHIEGEVVDGGSSTP